MNSRISTAFFTLLLLLLTSCATPPVQQDDGGPAADIGTDADTGDAAAIAAEVIETEEETSQDSPDDDGAEDAAETEEPALVEHEPLPPPEAVISPATPQVGEEISLDIDKTLYETVTFDFGEGPTEEAVYRYNSFGIKSITVTATAGDQTASSELSVPVTGTATLSLATDTVEHDANWAPLINAELEGEGDFDTIVVYENRREVLRASPPAEYKLPVPFTGERTFTAALFEGETKVADVAAVTITGLNTPPDKPRYEGSNFLTARAGEEVKFAVSAVDPNSDPVEYQVKFAPEGAVFDEVTGVFTWVPANAQRGVYLLHFTAYDQPYGLASQFAQRGIMVQ